MIFVTVGSQMPFDRLIRAMDDWALGRAEKVELFAQIGCSTYRPRGFPFAEAISPVAFRDQVARADLVVAHAGMGSILTGLELGKPLVLLPRKGGLQEPRNDHQVATARWLANRPGIYVAMDEGELPGLLDRVLEHSMEGERISTEASPALIKAIAEFVRA